MNRRHPSVVLAAFTAAIASAFLLLRMTPGERRAAPAAGVGGASRATDASGSARVVAARPEEPAFADSREQAASDAGRQPMAAATLAGNPEGEAVSEVPLAGGAEGDGLPVQWVNPRAHLERRARAIEKDAAERVAEVKEFRGTPLASLSPADAEYVARMVDAQARSRLEQLTATCRLSPAQREHVYRVLVPAMPSYHPELVVLDTATPSGAAPVAADAGGATAREPAGAGDVDDQIYAILDESQKTDFENDWIDRDLWWSEIIGQLSDDIDRELAAAVEAAPAAEALPDDVETSPPEEHLGGNLFDLLNP